MDIKEYVKDKYKWLYSITYWLGSGYKENGELDGQVDYLDYYISNEGFLCALGRGNCAKFIYPIGHGVRPMVTLSASNIKLPFIIQTQTDGNGNIEVVPSAYENETITFKVTPKPNYKLTSVKVTDTNGNTITYQEEDIINNKDNTITINKFTMPSDNVIINAIFKYDIVNPKTGYMFPILLLVLLIISSLLLVYSNKKQSLQI